MARRACWAAPVLLRNAPAGCVTCLGPGIPRAAASITLEVQGLRAAIQPHRRRLPGRAHEAAKLVATDARRRGAAGHAAPPRPERREVELAQTHQVGFHPRGIAGHGQADA
ncbi:hypothetical protein GCM10008179_26260 [Hansschlegelia plantiphila]|uniref:Uncharacterized protein n=1 Tax=Hansschlegelia plantiphila TaxID=374655 RepID=A0A9W6J3B7_9HYPH|nr:hypothetical protein GCM10008179_26260 [Hansschlegelia plantiphila]